MNIKRALVMGLTLSSLCTSQVQSADAVKIQQVDQVKVQGDTLLATVAGKTFSPTNTVGLPFEINVLTNLTFTVKEGPTRKLKAGQILSKDGMLLSPDGSIVPVMDHVAMVGGKVTLYKNGKSTVVGSVMTLGNGTKIFPDGTISEQNGQQTRLLDGQLFKLSGGTIPTKDTVTLRGGKVVVQKDGSMIPVNAGRTIMMNNGTKVFGDGQLIYFDGTKKQLSEGETVELEGVERNR